MHDELLNAIETIYDCVGEDYDRPQALRAYGKVADDSPLIMADMNLLLGRATRLDQYNIPDEVTEIFTTRFSCPVRDQFLTVLKNHPSGVPILRQSIVSDEVWQKSQMFKIGSKHLNLHSEGTSFITGKLLTKTFCFFSRRQNQNPLNAETLAMMAVLNKHLSRAMSMQHRFDKLEEALIQSSNVLDLIDFGLVLYGRDRAPVFVNAAARRILDAGDGMRLKKKGLVIGDREANEQFEALIDAIYRSNLALSERSGGIVTIPRQSRSRPYSLMVTPMQSRKTDMESVSAAVYLFDPSVRKTTAIEMFVSSYDLSRSEAELAHFLALGGTLEDVAERRGVSRNTAKTQLHSIFAKTETNRQSELVSLLLRSVAGINLKTD